VRCFTNAIEQILTVIAFDFYLKQKDSFTKDTMWLTALIALSFMMRNTSVIGWIPLLGIKVLFEGSLPPFIMSAILAGVPVIAMAVLVDTKYYNSTSLTPDNGPVLTSLNFMRINVSEGLAKYFGEDPAYWYVAVFGWAIYTVIYPWMIFAHFKVGRSGNP
jgi:hypothetical protein